MADNLKSVSVKIPDKIARDFRPADLMECGVPIRHGNATLLYRVADNGNMTLVRQYDTDKMSYLGRFETEMDGHYRTTISSNTAAEQGAKEDWDAPLKQTQKDKNAPGLEAPQVSLEGPKLLPKDEETHEQYMSRLRAERNVPPRPEPKKKQDIFPTPPPKPVVQAPPRSRAVASF
jgi:hypothetical protein